jgi:hypothetical protein
MVMTEEKGIFLLHGSKKSVDKNPLLGNSEATINANIKTFK